MTELDLNIPPVMVQSKTVSRYPDNLRDGFVTNHHSATYVGVHSPGRSTWSDIAGHVSWQALWSNVYHSSDRVQIPRKDLSIAHDAESAFLELTLGTST